MFDSFGLSDIKGAPLSILVFLSFNGNRAVTISELAGKDGTGYSEKPIRLGLRTLRELGVVTETHNRYQLTGKEYQLPLSWGEKILPAGVSPEYTGVFPGNPGVSPDMERRVCALEAAVFGGIDKDGKIKDQGTGDFPGLPGDSPVWEDDRVCDVEVIDEPRSEFSNNLPCKVDASHLYMQGRSSAPGKLRVFPVEKISVIKGEWKAAEKKCCVLGDSPEKKGELTGDPGVSPDGVNPLINNINNKEVGRYVDINTYLPIESNKSGVNKTGESEKQEPDVLWNAAKVQLQGQMDRGSYSAILKDAKLVGYADGHYTIGVTNAMARDWAEQRLTGTVERLLGTMSGSDVSVSFVVKEQGGVSLQAGGQFPSAASASGEPSPEMSPEKSTIELLPVSVDPAENELVEICNDYLRDGGDRYSLDQLSELIAIQPDPRVLRFAVWTLSSYKAVNAWCKWSLAEAKRKLLSHYSIRSNAALENDDNVSLEIIHDVCEDLDPEEKKYAISRIWMMAKGNVPM